MTSLLIVCVLFCCAFSVDGSAGNKAVPYLNCFRPCFKYNCTDDTSQSILSNQTLPQKLLGWTCEEECAYTCMWRYTERLVAEHSNVQQFHGKWPFVRVLGIQEPASSIFSLFNGIANLVWLMNMRKSVPHSTPMYKFWNVYAVVAINTWIWSTAYHARDVNFTEKMDYYFATLLGIFAAISAVIRLLGSQNVLWIMTIVFAIMFLFVLHLLFMSYVVFSYSYNMTAMVVLGSITSTLWLYWCYQVHRRQRYAWKCATVIITTNCLLFFFELNDFPPIFWIFDAHAIWHGLKIPIVFLWGSFVIDDMIYMNNKSHPNILITHCQSHQESILEAIRKRFNCKNKIT